MLDKQLALCDLVKLALSKKHQVTILTESQSNAAITTDYLWKSSPTDFIPNVAAPHELAANTPVVVDWQENDLLQDDILINLTLRQPTSFSRFKALIELVGVDEEDKAAARQRYKFYRDRGYEIQHIDYASKTN